MVMDVNETYCGARFAIYVYISNHYVGHQQLIQCRVSIIFKFKNRIRRKGCIWRGLREYIMTGT